MLLSGCSSKQNASVNNKMKNQTTEENQDSNDTGNSDSTFYLGKQADDSDSEQTAQGSGVDQELFDALAQDATQSESSDKNETDSASKDFGTPDATGRVGYHFDLEEDKKNFDGNADIVVGDNLYATQINDWYENFDQYEGKTVEIEGYYINAFPPYTFVGRYGPSCPYCNGGYVSFEFYSQDDLTALQPEQDWIKVTGILRQGEDSSGIFYYIEMLSMEKMDQVGKDTVTN